MSPKAQTFVIVGASLTGAKAAEELRSDGFDGRIVLIGDEPELPYERPPLTKNYLRGESPREKTRVHAPGFYEENEIELLTGVHVTAVEPAERRVHVDGGAGFVYERLLIATGAEPRKLDIPGMELDGVHYLRTLADCDALRARLEAGGKVVVVGAGWIGAEFAASARQCGLEVTVIEPASVPLMRVLGSELGGFYRDLHRGHGVEMRVETGVEAFEGQASVTGVRTSDGQSIACDFVVVGVGVVPRSGLAQAAGAKIENGIVVNQQLQTTIPNVFAAGDVANAWHPFFRRQIRVEHWANALNQGPAAAQAMLDQDLSYARIPYFFSDQYDVGMEYSGYATEWDQVVYRGAVDGGEFIAFWLKDRRVIAGMNVNVWDVNEGVQALIRSGQEVEAAALRDEDTPLVELVSEPAPATVDGRMRVAGSSPDRLRALHAAGVSVWLDTLSRELLDSGDFARLVKNSSVTGATSNPTIFARAITGSDRYDNQLRNAAESGTSDRQELFFELGLEDVREAAGVLREEHDRSGGRDGFVSFECTPDLADDTAATIAQAQALWERLSLPNVLIKVPATAGGVGAVEELTCRGVNVNVTLLFSVERYDQVIEAYLKGLERRRDAGEPLEGLTSVASFFVSRVDTKADTMLPPGSPMRGRVAIANAQLAYARYRERFSGPRWQELEHAGARAQRPLWASTGTKNTEYSDLLYVESLIADGVINTMPLDTLTAFSDHGNIGSALAADPAPAERALAVAADEGIDLARITTELERESVASFCDSYHELLSCIEGKLTALDAAAN
jgi:3-phenylpropionate/trans-cinnamate dioxygenase ferredoxin reductase component